MTKKEKKNMNENIKSWVPIIIALLGLIAGTGWLKYYLEQKNTERTEWKLFLANFLLPFDGIIKDNLLVFKELTDDEELRNLEYYPESLQQYFSNLPDNDPRKRLWKSRIDRLIKENNKAVKLIEQHRGKIVTNKFRDACEKFKYHAHKWEDLWKSVMDEEPIVNSEFKPEDVVTPKFPDSLEPALREEILLVRKLAGENENS